MNEPKHLDLFSGIGGFALAAQWAGFQTIGLSEIDPWCSAVLKKHWPGVTNYGDIRTVPAIGCDLLTGGFPCQPFSCAGKRRGTADDRHLWPAMLEVIRRCRPAWVVGENVPGIIGMALDDLCADLETAGYTVQPFVIPACAVDARHRRDRLWIVGHASSLQPWRQQPTGNNEAGLPGATGIAQAPLGNPTSTGRIPGTLTGIRSSEESARPRDAEPERRSETVANDSVNGRRPRRERRSDSSGARQPEQSLQTLANANGDNGHGRGSTVQVGRRWSTQENQRDGAGGVEWCLEPDVGRVAHGVPARVDRLRALGNAIVPQTVYPILKAIHDLIAIPTIPCYGKGGAIEQWLHALP